MKKLALAAVLVTALAWTAGGLSASGDIVHVSGAGVAGEFLLGDHVEVGAAGDAAGSWANGHLDIEGTLLTDNGNAPLHVGANVECIRVEGNRAVVAGHLPEPLTTDLLPGFVFTGAAAVIEDNGPPVNGQPVDRMVDFLLREQTLQAFCDTDLGFAFSGLLTPLVHGNYVVDD
jgi:hypothetical protein